MYKFKDPLYKEGISKSSRYSNKVKFEGLTITKTSKQVQKDHFVEQEEELAAFLAGLFISRTETIKKELLQAFSTNKINPIFIQRALTVLKDIRIITNAQRLELKKFFAYLASVAVDDSIKYANTKGLVGFDLFELAKRNKDYLVANKTDYVNNAVDKVEYYVNSFTDRILSKRLNPDKLDRESLVSIFNDNPYFGLLANSEVVKFYHINYLAALKAMNVKFYRYEAILDDVTTELCKGLHGTEYEVSTGFGILDTYYKSNADESKKVIPFFDTELSREELEARGVPMPGMHANCRSTLIGSDGSTYRAA